MRVIGMRGGISLFHIIEIEREEIRDYFPLSLFSSFVRMMELADYSTLRDSWLSSAAQELGDQDERERENNTYTHSADFYTITIRRTTKRWILLRTVPAHDPLRIDPCMNVVSVTTILFCSLPYINLYYLQYEFRFLDSALSSDSKPIYVHHPRRYRRRGSYRFKGLLFILFLPICYPLYRTASYNPISWVNNWIKPLQKLI